MAEGETQDRAALAAQALARAKVDAAARGTHPQAVATGKFGEKKLAEPAGPAAATASGGRVRREDPAPLNAAISALMREAGWELSVAAGSVFGRWAQIVGPDLAAHTTPVGLAEGELVVSADSTAWATQLRLLASQLVRRLNAELGDGAVLRVLVRGPGSGYPQAGGWRVRGGRGERDTYG
ncbi:MAG TPA: DciA family protein [Streptosporangiaceae bacterium]|nr:DciA family protein [Streptosporangiaceae bacterium]